MKQAPEYEVERAISNNVLLVKKTDTDKELVLIGKGIGFAVKHGDTIGCGDPRIEKIFRLDNHREISQYVLEDIKPEVIGLAEQIIDRIAAEFAVTVQPKVYFALPSHIQFAIYRLRNGMDIVNPFLYETKMCFPKEYEIARQAAERITERFAVDVPEDEIGFLAFHVHAAVTNVAVGQLVKFSAVISGLVDKIEARMNLRIPRDGADYVRLITHLRYAMERVVQQGVVPNPFLTELKLKMKEEFALAKELCRELRDHLQTEVPDDEIGYMALHLYRLSQSSLSAST
jgi:transcriptional antiterminator